MLKKLLLLCVIVAFLAAVPVLAEGAKEGSAKTQIVNVASTFRMIHLRIRDSIFSRRSWKRKATAALKLLYTPAGQWVMNARPSNS